ncbi:MAG: maleylpyruvate isomerase family mycothiol-dependent enzyme [Candidatus Dormibacteria bacterium]
MIEVTDRATARQALADVGNRAADLIESMHDTTRVVPGLTWTTLDVASHMVIAVRGFTDSLTGRALSMAAHIPDVDGYAQRMGAMTSSTLQAEPRRDPATLAALLRELLSDFLRESEARAPDERVPTPWYAPDASLSVDQATRLLTGEMWIHGYDVARGLNRPWPLDGPTALQIIPGFLGVVPHAFRPELARGFSAVVRVRIRGGNDYGWRFQNGTFEVAPWGTWGERRDVTLSAEPVAFLLLGYGRRSQWPLIASGRLLSYGRKPWLAPKLVSYFANA